MGKHVSLDKQAAAYVKKNKLPTSGWVCFAGGKPFGWSADKPSPESVVPLTIVFHLDSGLCDVARGGNTQLGAAYWESKQSRTHRASLIPPQVAAAG